MIDGPDNYLAEAAHSMTPASYVKVQNYETFLFEMCAIMHCEI